MRHTDTQIDDAARRFEALADALDPTTVEAERLDDLERIGAVTEALHAEEAKLREVVADARSHGRSWNEIAIALGVSRQAARQRFADKITA
jgi:DNA-directed RNA polymerase specialized sigma24 family protein